ncbi:hypothetical protein STEG23_002763, partial [Scotinomys teguina]
NMDIYKLSSIYAASAREFGLNVGEEFLESFYVPSVLKDRFQMRSIYLEMPGNSAEVEQLLNSNDGSLQAGGNCIRQLSPPEGDTDGLTQEIDPAMTLARRE